MAEYYESGLDPLVESQEILIRLSICSGLQKGSLGLPANHTTCFPCVMDVLNGVSWRVRETGVLASGRNAKVQVCM